MFDVHCTLTLIKRFDKQYLRFTDIYSKRHFSYVTDSSLDNVGWFKISGNPKQHKGLLFANRTLNSEYESFSLYELIRVILVNI